MQLLRKDSFLSSNDTLTLNGQIQKESVSSTGAFTGILSTPSIDAHNDRVLPKAFSKFLHVKKPLLIGHNTKELPVGHAAIVSIDDKAVIVKGQVSPSSPRFAEIVALMKEGVLFFSWAGKAAPGGVRYVDGVTEYSALEIVTEFTLTGTPANPDTLVVPEKSWGRYAAETFRNTRNEKGCVVPHSLLKVAGDPILSGSTYATGSSNIDPTYAARAGTWLSIPTLVPVASGLVAMPRLTGCEGDVAETAENSNAAELHPTFALSELTIANVSGSVEVAKQVLDDSPALMALVFDHLRMRIVRKIERRFAEDAIVIAPTVDVDVFASFGELADLDLTNFGALVSPKKYWALAKAQTNTDAPVRFGGVPAFPCAGLTTTGLAVSWDASRVLQREAVDIHVGMVGSQFTSGMREVAGFARVLAALSDHRAVRQFQV